jgi:hypothetical protein
MSCLETTKMKSSNIFKIGNGIVGMKRDVIFQLMEVIYFRSDGVIQNVFQFNFQLMSYFV